MEFFDALNQRQSYRGTYTNAPVPREHLRQILDAGLAAPSGCNTQTTSLVGIDDPALLAKLRTLSGLSRFAAAPAGVLVLAQDIPGRSAGRWYTQDYSAAIENMLLGITALGYASCWVEGYVTLNQDLNDAIRSALSIPEKYLIIAYLPVGVPESPLTGPEKYPFEQRAWFNTDR